MTRQVAMLLRAGSGIVPAFSAIQRQTTRPGHTALIGRIIADLEDGLPLTDALRKHPRSFDAVYCAIVAAGEASGTLTEMFDRLSVIVGKTRAMRKKILGALAYPCLLTVMCSHIFLVLLFFVIPRFNDMFIQLGVEAPASTKMLLATSGALRAYWPLLAGAVILAAAGVFWLVTSDRGKAWLSDVQLMIPLLGRLRSRLIQGQVFRTMGTLLESRVNVLEALGLVRESTRNRRFQSLFDELEAALQSGGRLSTTFESSGIVEPYICQAVHTGEDTGNLGGAITFCADMLDETNEELINLIMKLLEPLILIVMGAAVGGVAISLFMPLFDLTAGIR
jgi:type II secretory pathway component PulF